MQGSNRNSMFCSFLIKMSSCYTPLVYPSLKGKTFLDVTFYTITRKHTFVTAWMLGVIITHVFRVHLGEKE